MGGVVGAVGAAGGAEVASLMRVLALLNVPLFPVALLTEVPGPHA